MDFGVAITQNEFLFQRNLLLFQNLNFLLFQKSNFLKTILYFKKREALS